MSPSLRIPPHNKTRPHLALLLFFPPHHYRTAQLQTLCTFCIAFPTANPFAIASIYLLLSRIISNCYSRFVVRYVAPPSLLMFSRTCPLRVLLAAILACCDSCSRFVSRCNHFPLHSCLATIVFRCKFCLSLDGENDPANSAVLSSRSPLSLHIHFIVVSIPSLFYSFEVMKLVRCQRVIVLTFGQIFHIINIDFSN